MTLAAGSRVGSYEIVSLLGVGGMGEVYRAHDARLGRDVAIKILPAAFAADPDRLARVEREARVLASLNHPHIATIHGIEEAAGVPALVLELVEGQMLSDRIARGPIPLTGHSTVKPCQSWRTSGWPAPTPDRSSSRSRRAARCSMS